VAVAQADHPDWTPFTVQVISHAYNSPAHLAGAKISISQLYVAFDQLSRSELQWMCQQSENMMHFVLDELEKRFLLILFCQWGLIFCSKTLALWSEYSSQFWHCKKIHDQHHRQRTWLEITKPSPQFNLTG